MTDFAAAPTTPAPTPATRGSLAVVFLTVLIDLLGFGMVVPLLQVYADKFGASGVAIGWLMAVFSLMQFLFAPVWGRVSDRIGRKPVLLIGLIGSFGSYLLFGFAQSLPLLFVSRMFAGFFGANISTAQAYVADVTTPENRAKGMGMIGAAFGIGFVFGPPVGGTLAHWHPSAPGFFAAGLSLSAFVFGWFRLRESHRPGEPSARRRYSFADVGAAVADPRLATLLVGYLFVTFAFAGFETTFMNLGGKVLHYDTRTMGFLLGGAGFASALVQGRLIHTLVRRFGERALLVAGSVALGIGFFGVAIADAAALFLGSALVVGIAYGFCNPSMNALISKNASRARQGAVLGVAQSCASLGRVLGPICAGIAWDRSIRAPYVLGGSVVLALALVFEAYRRRFPTDPVATPGN